MKIVLESYVDASNGFCLALQPESEIEEGLLKLLLAHGTITGGHPCSSDRHPVLRIAFKPIDEKSQKAGA